MSSKSMELADESNKDFRKAFIQSQFCTKIQKAPPSTDLSGRVMILTGATSGIGLRCVEHLLSLKLSHLIMAVRSVEKGRAVAKSFESQYPLAKIDVWELEMESYASIQAFCRKVDADLTRLDVAILNAGITELSFHITPSTGHEKTLQVNYLSTFLLAILMLPILKKKAPKGAPSRLTIVNSGVALEEKLPCRDMRPLLAANDDEKILPYDAGTRYSDSKLLGQLFFVRLLKYLRPDDVIVNLVDPGFCKGTDLHRTAKGGLAFALSVMKTLTGRTMEAGAWTYVDAAVVKGKESHGCFVMDWEIRPFTHLIYTPEGETIMDVLWKETMAEFEFAGAQQILEDFKNGA
ncbi:NAD(P)-binding protein [Thozetella sp. PMI_491]|nr:NAD(P)-binding protein [Thozetella sp. PMI_491]